MAQDQSTRGEARKAAEKVVEIVEPILDAKNLVLVNARFTNQGKRRILEVTIHRPKSTVSLEDCESVSRELDKKLDKLAKSKTGPIVDGAYVLQVQSPGIDRKLKTLKELKVFVGERVEVESSSPIDSLGVSFTGILEDASEGRVTITQPKKVEIASGKKKRKKKKKESGVLTQFEEISLELKSLSSVRLSPDNKSATDEDSE